MKQATMFNDGQDLPLFSGAPITVTPKAAKPHADRQPTLFGCPICHDTGTIVMPARRGKTTKTRRCWCPAGQ